MSYNSIIRKHTFALYDIRTVLCSSVRLELAAILTTGDIRHTHTHYRLIVVRSVR